jgi:hypothetical protein
MNQSKSLFLLYFLSCQSPSTLAFPIFYLHLSLSHIHTQQQNPESRGMPAYVSDLTDAHLLASAGFAKLFNKRESLRHAKLAVEFAHKRASALQLQRLMDETAQRQASSASASASASAPASAYSATTDPEISASERERTVEPAINSNTNLSSNRNGCEYPSISSLLFQIHATGVGVGAHADALVVVAYHNLAERLAETHRTMLAAQWLNRAVTTAKRFLQPMADGPLAFKSHTQEASPLLALLLQSQARVGRPRPLTAALGPLQIVRSANRTIDVALLHLLLFLLSLLLNHLLLVFSTSLYLSSSPSPHSTHYAPSQQTAEKQ